MPLGSYVLRVISPLRSAIGSLKRSLTAKVNFSAISLSTDGSSKVAYELTDVSNASAI